MNGETPFKKSLREKMLNLCGMYWWPPTHNDPRIMGPQPRLVTREQYECLMKMRGEHGDDTPQRAKRLSEGNSISN